MGKEISLEDLVMDVALRAAARAASGHAPKRGAGKSPTIERLRTKPCAATAALEEP